MDGRSTSPDYTPPRFANRRQAKPHSGHIRSESSAMDFFHKLNVFGSRRQDRTPTAVGLESTPKSSRSASCHSRAISEPLSPAQLEIRTYRDLQDQQYYSVEAGGAPPIRAIPVPPPPPPPPATNADSVSRGSILRGLKHCRSITALRRKKSKTYDHSPAAKSTPSPGSTPTRSILKRTRKKSNLSQRNVPPPEPQYPVPPLPVQYRQQNAQSHVSLHTFIQSRNTVLHDDHDECTSPGAGSAESDPISVRSLRPPPPTRRTTDTSPRAHAPPAEVALEFGTTPSPKSARVLQEASAPKQHRRTQSVDEQPRVDGDHQFTNKRHNPPQDSKQTLTNLVFPVSQHTTPPKLARLRSLQEERTRKRELRPFPPHSDPEELNFAERDSLDDILDATPTKATSTRQVDFADPESTILPNLSDTEPIIDASLLSPDRPKVQQHSASDLDPQSNRGSLESRYSEQSRHWSPDNDVPEEWTDLDEEEEFAPGDGSFGGHNNPYAGKSLSTIVEADTPATSYRFSQASTVMLRRSRDGSSPKSESQSSQQLILLPRKATPVNETFALLEAQKAETSAVKTELEACKLVIKHLQDEKQKAHVEAEEKDSRLRRLEDKVNELEDALDETRMALTAKEEAVEQLEEKNEVLMEEHRHQRQMSPRAAASDSPLRVSIIERQYAEDMHKLRIDLEMEKGEAVKEVERHLAETKAKLQQVLLGGSEHDLRIETLEARVQAAEFLAKEAEVARETIKAEKTELFKQIEKLEDENAKLADDLEQAAEDRDAIIDERDAALEDRDEAIEEQCKALDQLKELNIRMEEEADRSMDENYAIADELAIMTREKKTLDVVVETVEQRYNTLKKHADQIAEDRGKVANELALTQKRLRGIEGVTVPNLEARIASMTEMLEARNDGSQEAEEELANLSMGTVVQQEHELIALRDELSNVKAELSQVQEQFSQHAKGAEEELTELRGDLQGYEEGYNQLTKDLEEAIKDRDMYREKAAEHWTRMQGYIGQVDSLKIREEQLRDKIAALEAQSSRDSLKQTELTRRLAIMTEDRDMLHNALDSKGMELELLRRGQAHQRRVSQMSPSSKDKIRLRVRTSPPRTIATTKSAAAAQDTLQTPTPLTPTSKHNTLTSITSLRALPAAPKHSPETGTDRPSDRPLMQRHGLTPGNRTRQLPRRSADSSSLTHRIPVSKNHMRSTSGYSQASSKAESRGSRHSHMSGASGGQSVSSLGTLAGRFGGISLDEEMSE